MVVDFEATCSKNKGELKAQEIIEFTAILIDIKTKKPISKFHEYIKPVICPELTEFCTKLTGITQDMVINADEFPYLYKRFIEWLKINKLDVDNPLNKDGYKFGMLTCGAWDFDHVFKKQLKLVNMKSFPCFDKWINI